MIQFKYDKTKDSIVAIYEDVFGRVREEDVTSNVMDVVSERFKAKEKIVAVQSKDLTECVERVINVAENENIVPMLQRLKNICDEHADSCECYGNGKDTSCPMYSICDDEYGVHFPCNWKLESDV